MSGGCCQGKSWMHPSVSMLQRLPRGLAMLDAVTGEKRGPYSNTDNQFPIYTAHIPSSYDSAGSWDLAAIKSRRSGSFCVGLGLSSMDGTGDCFKLRHLTRPCGTL